MQILHVLSGIDQRAGGPVTALVGMAEAQARTGLDVTIVTTWCRGHDLSVADQLKGAGVKVELVGPAVGRLGSWHPRLPQILHQLVGRTDLVHIHALWEDIQHQAARACRRRGVPYVITPHGMLDEWSMSHGSLRKRLYLAWRMRKNLTTAALLHFTTEAERASVARLSLPVRQVVEPLGVDLGEFDALPPLGLFRQRFPAVGDRPYVLFLGRIKQGKGLELLLPALGRLARRDISLVIAGPDEDFRDAVEQMIDAHGLRAQVIFTGMIRGIDRVAVLQDAYILALPSFHENFGIVVIEALAAGTPVVVSDQVNICNEIARAGVGGVVPIDVHALAQELERWLSSPELQSAAAAKSRPFVWNNFDWNVIARHWVRHYAECSPMLERTRST